MQLLKSVLMVAVTTVVKSPLPALYKDMIMCWWSGEEQKENVVWELEGDLMEETGTVLES